MATIDSKLAVKALAALAHETRLSVFRLLVTAGRSGMSPGAIAEKLGLPAPTLSFHLKELAHAELIEGKSQGRFIIYCASYDHMQTLTRREPVGIGPFGLLAFGASIERHPHRCCRLSD